MIASASSSVRRSEREEPTGPPPVLNSPLLRDLLTTPGYQRSTNGLGTSPGVRLGNGRMAGSPTSHRSDGWPILRSAFSGSLLPSGRLDQSFPEPAIAFPSAATAAFAGAFVLARTDGGPRA